MELRKNSIPCMCQNLDCGLLFQNSNLFSGNITMTGCVTNCPFCGGSAVIMDGQLKPSGEFTAKDFFQFVKDIGDKEKLKKLSQTLNAANDDVTTEDLSKELMSIDDNYSLISKAIKSVPQQELLNLIQTLCAIITMMIVVLGFIKDDPLDDIIEIETKKLNLLEKSSTKNYQELKEYQKKLDELEHKLEGILDEDKESSCIDYSRNMSCPCGSDKRLKHCHPKITRELYNYYTPSSSI